MSADEHPPTPDEEIFEPIPFGKFTLLEEIGSGGMAAVFLARQKGVGSFSRLVVIKRILPHLAGNPRFVELFLEEARIAAMLDHPNVLPVYDLGRVGDDYFIAMPFVDGVTVTVLLDHAIEKGQPLGAAECCELGVQALKGLHYAHERRDENGALIHLIHRDVTPSNLMINREGRVVLLDFGVATVRDSPLWHRAQLRGKPTYMSPEQARAKPLDRRSDIFSLAIILYELLSATRLFKRDVAAATISAICDENIPPLSQRRPDLAPALTGLIDRALERDPAKRFATAAEMAEALERLPRELGLAHGRRKLASLAAAHAPGLLAHLRQHGRPRRGAREQTVDATPSSVATKVRRQHLALLVLIVLLFAAAMALPYAIKGPPLPAGKPLRIAIAPHLPARVIRREATPLVDYLQRKLQRPVKLHITKTYAALVDELVANKVDVADLSGYPFLLARQRSRSVDPLVSVLSERSSSYEAYLLVRRSSKARRLDQMRGKIICYVDRQSTSGYLMPRLMAREQGLDPDQLFAKWHRSGNHHHAMRDLLAGRCHLAAVSSESYITAAAHGIPSTALRVLAISRSLPYGVYCASAMVSEQDKSALRAALRALDMRRAFGRARLGDSLRITGYGPVDLALFDALQRELAALERGGGGAGR